VVYVLGDEPGLDVTTADGQTVSMPGNCLDVATSCRILERDGWVQMVQATVRF
jgi:hypothetical protein